MKRKLHHGVHRLTLRYPQWGPLLHWSWDSHQTWVLGCVHLQWPRRVLDEHAPAEADHEASGSLHPAPPGAFVHHCDQSDDPLARPSVFSLARAVDGSISHRPLPSCSAVHCACEVAWNQSWCWSQCCSLTSSLAEVDPRNCGSDRARSVVCHCCPTWNSDELAVDQHQQRTQAMATLVLTPSSLPPQRRRLLVLAY